MPVLEKHIGWVTTPGERLVSEAKKEKLSYNIVKLLSY